MPAPTPAELVIMKDRMHAAKSALRFFKDIRPIESMTRVFDPTWMHHFQHSRRQKIVAINNYREITDGSSVMDLHAASSTGLGNCGEKASVVYVSLIGNPIIFQQPSCHVTFCSAMGYDHAFVMVTDRPVECYTRIQSLGVTALLVDGWMEDAYFPNSSTHVGFNIPNPWQLRIRHILRTQDIRPMEKTLVPDFTLPYINSYSETTKF